MQQTKKKQIVVVKNLRDLSPKKTLLVSKKPDTEDSEGYDVTDAVGNASPMKVEKVDGVYLTRSFLGDPNTFEELEKRGRVVSPTKGQSKRKARPVVKKVEETLTEESIAAEAVKVRVLRDPGLYISTLQSQYSKSESVRLKDEKRQTQLMEYLPVNEKFNMNKEGQVLTRWQERQRDWINIQEQISKRINASRTHSLMMSKTFDYRIKREEYDLIQAAIPSEVKFGSSVWERSLRNGNTRVVSVGHVFTGLECEIDGAVPPPVLIRRPRPAQLANTSITKAFDVTEAMLKTKKRWKTHLDTLRPHDLAQEDADSLQINCTGLFEWAMESAKAYFDGVKEAQGFVNQVGSPFDIDSRVNGSSARREEEGPVPTLELISSPEVIFNTTSNKTTRRLVTFQNTGTVAIEYNWKPECHVDSVERAYRDGVYFGSAISQILDDKIDCLPRTSAYIHKKSICFFCSQPKGIILPGETLSILFGFNSTNIPAVVSQMWKMHTTPRTKFSHRVVSPVVNNNGGPTSEVKSVQVDMMALHLHGVVAALEMDEAKEKRNEMVRFLNKQALNAMAEDEYLWCLRRVRLPVRQTDLHNRYLQAFCRINSELLTNLSKQYGSSSQFFVTPTRLAAMEALCSRVANYNAAVCIRIHHCRMKRLALLEGLDGSTIDIDASASAQIDGEVNVILQRHCNADVLAALKNEVFPEKKIEIFDEVTEDAIEPKWDLDLAHLIRSLQESLELTYEVQTLEIQIKAMEIANEKQRIKEAKRMQRLALRKPGDDDDDEEEDDEEEEEADEDSAAAIPKHELTVVGEELIGECRGSLLELVTRHISSSAADASLNGYANNVNGIFQSVSTFPLDAVSSTIGDCLMNLGDWIAEAKEAASIDAHAAIAPAWDSPFTSHEAAKAWKQLLAPEPEPDTGKKGGKAKPPAAKKGKQDKGAPLTPEQITEFYGKAHEIVKNQLLDLVEKVFEVIDSNMEEQCKQRIAHISGVPRAVLGCSDVNVDLPSVSCLSFLPNNSSNSNSSSFLAGKIVLQSFDGEAFIAVPNVSAYPVKEQAQKLALEATMTAAQRGAAAIVLIHESSSDKGYFNRFGSTVFPRVKELLVALETEAYEFDQSRKRKKSYDKSKARLKIDFKVQFCRNMAELTIHLNQITQTLSKQANGKSTAQSQSEGRSVPVLLMEDLRHVEAIVPACPPLPELVETDEEAPIDIGLDEYLTFRAESWAIADHRSIVTVGAAAPVPSTSNLRTSSNSSLNCLTSPLAAFNEFLTTFGGKSVWIESASDGLCGDKDSVLSRAAIAKQISHIAISEQVQQTLLWSSVVQQLPRITDLLQSVASADVESNSTVSDKLFAQFASALFPRNVSPVTIPRVVACVGGMATADKFRVLDELIDSVPIIFVGGELCIPFLALSKRVQFKRYQYLCSSFRQVCASIARKAKLRGTQFILPVDILSADESIDSEGSDLRLKCFAKFDPDSRDEGADYSGEIKSIEVSYPSGGPLHDEYLLLGPVAGFPQLESYSVPTVSVDGYVYDIGEKSRKQLQDLLTAKCDLLLSWGPLGACEVSGFQMGQRTLVQSSVLPPWPEGAIQAPPINSPHYQGKPLHTWVIGESNSEWFSRYADPDGEFQGDLVEAGRLAFVSRSSKLCVGVLGRLKVECLSRLTRNDNSYAPDSVVSWRINMKNPLYPEEDDEEDEDE